MEVIILIRDNLVELEQLKNFLPREFEIKGLGTLRYFLGMEVIRSKVNPLRLQLILFVS